LVSFAPVSDARNVHGFSGVVDDVNDAVVADSDSPFAIAAFELLAAGRPRVQFEPFEAGTIRAIIFLGRSRNSFSALEVSATR
jgi:hypothetical protein